MGYRIGSGIVPFQEYTTVINNEDLIQTFLTNPFNVKKALKLSLISDDSIEMIVNNKTYTATIIDTDFADAPIFELIIKGIGTKIMIGMSY